nr:phosphoribosyltransferase family protein [Oceanisphaera litoralis]
MAEIYTVPSTVVQAAPLLASWLGERQEPLLLVGPDAESEQWVAQIAARSGHDYVVGSKVRSGDRQVAVRLPDLSAWRRHTAVIIDDVISSGQTVLRCLQALHAQGLNKVDCAAIHGLFADHIEQQLTNNGLRRLITTNAIAHSSNAIDLSPLLLAPIRERLAAC